MIKPLTQTGAGLAQVFDTSGYVQAERQERAKKEQRIDKELLDYNPNGLYDKDIPAYQQLMTEYQSFVADRHDELLNSSENMDVWREKMHYENQIKNFIAGSTRKNKQYQSMLQATATNPDYMNKDNRDMLDGFRRGINADDYKAGDIDIWDMNLDDLHYNIEHDAFSTAKEIAATIGIQTQDISELKDAVAAGLGMQGDEAKRQFYSIAQTIKYDPEKLESKLLEIWDAPNKRGRDLQYEYKDFENFKEAMYPALISTISEDIGSYGLGKGDGAEPPKGFYDVLPQTGSTTVIYEPAYVNAVDERGREIIDPETGETKKQALRGAKQRGLATVNKSVDEETGQMKVETGGGKVLRFGGKANIVISGHISGGTNLTTGELISEDEAQIYKSSKVIEVGNYWRARKDFPIDLIGGGVMIIEKGSWLPDVDGMLAAGEISQTTYDKVMKGGVGRIIQSAEGAVLASFPEDVSLMQRAEGAKYTEEKMKSGGGAIYSIMPLDAVYTDINTSVNASENEMAVASNGDPLGVWMDAYGIRLDDTYLDFWSSGKSSGLR